MSINISTFVFFDIETTGLPFQEKNQTKITELSMVAACKEDIMNTPLGSIPKVNTLTLAFNPQKRIHPDAVKMNGLTNKILKNAPKFCEKFTDVYDFLINLSKPVCLIAHNGNNFDYRILLAECNDVKLKLPTDLLCYDSLTALRDILGKSNISFETLNAKEQSNIKCDASNLSEEDDWPELELSTEDLERFDVSVSESLIDNNKKRKTKKPKRQSRSKMTKTQLQNRDYAISNLFTKGVKPYDKSSFKLEALYKRLLNKTPTNSHRAETDCFMLLECVVALKCDFIMMAESSCVMLNSIQPLTRY